MERCVPKGDFIALYAYGSRVYGNAQPHSDYDYVGIQKGVDKGTIIQGNVNIKLMSPEHFQGLLDEHRMTALECYFLPQEHILKAPDRPWKFKLNKAKLIETVTERSAEDWAKAELRFARSLEAASEVERGKKSLYHSIRLVQFGIDIASFSRITDYSMSNTYFEEIMTDPSDSWDHYKESWEPTRIFLLDCLRSFV